MYLKEEFEDAKINKSKKDRQHNGAKNKTTNNDLQNITQKTKYRVTRPPPPKERQILKQENTTQTIEVEIRYCNQSI